MFIFQSKTEEWSNGKDNCNTNNHIDLEQDEIYKKYKKRLIETHKDNWIKWFPDNSIQIPINKYFCDILCDACYIGFIKHKPPAIYKEELVELEKYIEKFIPSNITKWFIRLSPCSPKDGMYGSGPLISAKEIVSSIATSYRAFTCFNYVKQNDLDKEILYLVPWRDDWYEDGYEFRVFVYNRNITCISQYNHTRDIGLYEDLLKEICGKIKIFYDSIKDKIPLESFVIDVIYVNEKIELVEFNSFGKDSASGSSLFHWLDDFELLYGNGENIFVRYTKN